MNIFTGGALQLLSTGGTPLGLPIAIYSQGVANDGGIRSTGTSAISGQITVGNTSRINSDSGTLTISGTGGIVSNATPIGRDLYVGGAGNVTISAPIGGGGGSNNIGSLIKDGTGTVTLSGTNTYAGATTANNGLLVINNSALCR